MILVDYCNLPIRCRCCYATDHLVRMCSTNKMQSSGESINPSEELAASTATKVATEGVGGVSSEIPPPPAVRVHNPTILVDSSGAEESEEARRRRITGTNSEETTSRSGDHYSNGEERLTPEVEWNGWENVPRRKHSVRGPPLDRVTTPAKIHAKKSKDARKEAPGPLVTPLSSSSSDPPPLVRTSKDNKVPQAPCKRQSGPTNVGEVARDPCASRSSHGPMSPSLLPVTSLGNVPDEVMADSVVLETQRSIPPTGAPDVVSPALSLVPPALWYVTGQDGSTQGVLAVAVPALNLVRAPGDDLVFQAKPMPDLNNSASATASQSVHAGENSNAFTSGSKRSASRSRTSGSYRQSTALAEGIPEELHGEFFEWLQRRDGSPTSTQPPRPTRRGSINHSSRAADLHAATRVRRSSVLLSSRDALQGVPATSDQRFTESGSVSPPQMHKL